MSEYQWIRSHVERLLQEEWGICRTEEDDDGDYPFRAGTAAGWVSVVIDDPIMVRVFAHAATGVKPSLGVLRELNEIEAQSFSVSICLSGGTVTVFQTVNPIGLTQEVLAQAIAAVNDTANDVAGLLATVFGGTTPYPAQVEAEEEAA